MGRHTAAKTTKSGRRNMFQKTGVTFPIRRIQRYTKQHHTINRKCRVSTSAAVYFGAVLEYVTAEVLELAGMAAKHDKKRRINPRSILLAVKSDDEFRQLLKGIVMPECGNLWGEILQPASSASSTITSGSIGNSNAKPIKNRQTTTLSVNVPTTSAAPQHVSDGQHGAVSTLGQKVLVSGLLLHVLQGDITSVEADCYVNPTSSHVGFGGQVGSRILQIGGTELQNIISQHSNAVILPNGAYTTPAVGLKAGHILHCNSPSWAGANSIQNLEETVNNCLTEACAHHFQTVAFPSIGSGGNQFPKHTAAQTIIRTISTFFKNRPKNDADTKKILLVLFDKQSVNVFKTELGRLME